MTERSSVVPTMQQYEEVTVINEGALTVNAAERARLGRIMNGAFIRSRSVMRRRKALTYTHLHW